MSRLVNLVNLKKISIAYNPCVNMTGSNMYPLIMLGEEYLVAHPIRATWHFIHFIGATKKNEIGISHELRCFVG